MREEEYLWSILSLRLPERPAAADERIGWKEMLSAAEKVYTGEEWRDAAGYDLSLDSEQLGEDGCVELIRKILPLFT